MVDLKHLSQYVRTVSVFFSQLFLQLIQVLIVAKTLSLDEAGIYFVVTSISGILSEAAGIGYSEAMIRDISLKNLSTQEACYGFAIRLGQTLPIAALAATIMLFISIHPNASVTSVIILYMLDIFGTRMLFFVEHAWMANADLAKADIARFIGPISRVTALLLATSVFKFNLGFAIAFAGATGGTIMGILLAISIIAHFGRPRSGQILPIRDTFAFSLNQLARASQQNLDRYVLSFMFRPSDVAIYTIATRLVIASLLPVQAIMRNNYMHYFRLGRRGIKPLVLLTIWLGRPVLAVASICAFGIVGVAPLLPIILGQKYHPAVYLAQSMALLPLLWAAYYLVANIMSGINRQYSRSAISLFSVAATSSLLLFLAPIWGLSGSVVAQYIGITMSLSLTIIFLLRSETNKLSIWTKLLSADSGQK